MFEMRDLTEDLNNCLSNCLNRFSNYQDIPDFVAEKLNERFMSYYSKKNRNQLSLDKPRYDFLLHHIKSYNLNILEIGSNLGYFCLLLSYYRDAKCVGYEPIVEYAKASNIMARLSEVDNRCLFEPVGVINADISKLHNVDLLIELNVAHHAGAVFDVGKADTIIGWKNYILDRLKRYREKTKYLLFQTGNTRNGETLFENKDSIPFLGDLLIEAGYKIIAVGMIDDLNKLVYKSYSYYNIDAILTFQCERNRETDLVDYWQSGTYIKSLPTGMANRPIFICE